MSNKYLLGVRIVVEKIYVNPIDVDHDNQPCRSPAMDFDTDRFTSALMSARELEQYPELITFAFTNALKEAGIEFQKKAVDRKSLMG